MHIYAKFTLCLKAEFTLISSVPSKNTVLDFSHSNICNFFFQHWETDLASIKLNIFTIQLSPHPQSACMPPHPLWALISPVAFPTCGCPHDPQNVGSDTPDQLTINIGCPHHPTKALTSCVGSGTMLQDCPYTPHSCLPHPTWALTPHSRLTSYMVTFPSSLGSGFPVSGQLFWCLPLCPSMPLCGFPCQSHWALTTHASPLLYGSGPTQALNPYFLHWRHSAHPYWALLPMPGCLTMGNFLILLGLWLSMLGISHPAWVPSCCLRVPHGWVVSLPHLSYDTSPPYMDMDALLISLGLQDSMLGFFHR